MVSRRVGIGLARTESRFSLFMLFVELLRGRAGVGVAFILDGAAVFFKPKPPKKPKDLSLRDVDDELLEDVDR